MVQIFSTEIPFEEVHNLFTPFAYRFSCVFVFMIVFSYRDESCHSKNGRIMETIISFFDHEL